MKLPAQRPPKGISVILCCHNSRKRIPATLEALALQKIVDNTRWEIVLVDNASTDGTAGYAIEIWNGYSNIAPLRVVTEPVPGLANARNKGIAEAQFDILVFCDDDNWLDPYFIFTAALFFENNRQAAACGSLGIPHFEIEPPLWFHDYAEAFATGAQDKWKEGGRILSLYGAGLVVRKECISQLHSMGFEPIMTGRKGNKLSSSEDTELTNAFVLAGFELHYSSRLRFKHFLPKERLTRKYLTKLFQAFGADGPVRNMYYSAITAGWVHRQLSMWAFHFLFALARLVKYLVLPPKPGGAVIYFLWSIAYLKQLLRLRSSYSSRYQKIQALKKTVLDQTGGLLPVHRINPKHPAPVRKF